MAKKKKKLPKPNAIYTLPSKVPVADKIVIGMDPGSRNFGISVVGITNGKVKVFANSVLTLPINDLVRFNASRAAFLAEIKRWVDWCSPNGITAERFQTRGNGGPLIEMVSNMTGLIGGAYPDIPLKLTIASAWKNKFNRRFGCDLKEIYPDVAVQPHQLDATLIGIYGLEAGTGADVDYAPDDIIKQVESTSLIDLRRMKTRGK